MIDALAVRALRGSLSNLLLRWSSALAPAPLHRKVIARADPTLRLPASRVVSASFSFALPAAANQAQIEEWVRFCLGSGSIAASNPLADDELELQGQVTLKDSCAHRHIVAFREGGQLYLRSYLAADVYRGPSEMELITNPNHPLIQEGDPNGKA
jgi:hypothetical protein